MVQNKVKHKVSLPVGLKKKGGGVSKKEKHPISIKRGQKLHIAPKKQAAQHEGAISKNVSKIINSRNQELLASRAQSNTDPLNIVGTSGSGAAKK